MFPRLTRISTRLSARLSTRLSTGLFTRLSTPLAVLLSCCAMPALAIETQTLSQLVFRGTKALDSTSTVDFTFTERDIEGFEKHDREMAETRYFQKFGDNDVMVGYHIEFDRTGLLGNEHRLMEQIRHQFTLDNKSFDTSLRLEERYFDANYSYGTRLRWLTHWNMPLSQTNLVRLGYEWIYDIDYISKTSPLGIAQNRLIGSIQHTLSNRDKVEFEFQARYLYTHVGSVPNTLQNQVQLQYTHNF
jgi:hypothetical protein